MMGLPQETEILIVKFPVMAPTSQVLNSITLFHEGGGLMRESFGVNTHKYVKNT